MLVSFQNSFENTSDFYTMRLKIPEENALALRRAWQ